MKHPAEALPHFDRALSLIPQRWAYHFNRGRALDHKGQRTEAAAGYREYLRLAPEALDADEVRARIAQLTESGS